MSFSKKVVLSLTLALMISVAGKAQVVWQWSVPINNTTGAKAGSKAYLWIPEKCKRIRAFIFAQNNMEEQSILENANFRKKMAELDVAEVWVSPAYDLFFNFSTGAGDTFNWIMSYLADASGYKELSSVPFIGLGHSAAASAPYYMAAWNPERALAAVSVSGQWPYFRGLPFAADIWGSKNVDFIPLLETMGEYEAADTWSREGLKERQEHPFMPLSMLACPAEGHFCASQEKIDYIAFYIKKAMQYRLRPGSLKLVPVDPSKTGWLADKWRFQQPPVAAAAPVGQYKGNLQDAFWYFDKETADYTTAYEARFRYKKAQLIGYMEHGQMVAQHNTHQQVNLKFEPDNDGITFHLHAAYYDTVPGGSPRPAMWAGLPVGSKIGHVEKNSAIRMEVVAGPVRKVNDSTFQVYPSRGYPPGPKTYQLWFAAKQDGDSVYKPAVQQSEMIVPPLNEEGKVQHLKFDGIPDQIAGSKNIRLHAVSDAKVPVYFYIEDGPAIIVNGKINLTAVPPGSKWPVKVTVVAWQYGRGIEPKLQTAEQVERVFWIKRP